MVDYEEPAIQNATQTCFYCKGKLTDVPSGRRLRLVLSSMLISSEPRRDLDARVKPELVQDVVDVVVHGAF